MGCCSSRAPGSHEWQAQVPGSYKANPIPKVNKQTEVAPDFFMKCYMKGYLRTMPKKQRIWCMIHENNLYFMDSAEDTLPKKFLCFDGCLVNLKGKELEIQTPEIMEGAVPRATYKFVAEGEDVAMEWYENSLKASSRRN